MVSVPVIFFWGGDKNTPVNTVQFTNPFHRPEHGKLLVKEQN